MTKEDLKHSLNFDDFPNLVLKNISKKCEKFMLKQLDKFYNNIIDFTVRYNDKYYRAGFANSNCYYFVLFQFIISIS